MAIYYGEGTYQATILSHTFTPSDYGVQLSVVIEPIVDGEAKPRTVYLAFLDAEGNPSEYSDKTVEVLQTLGYSDDPSRLDANSDNPVSLVGVECTAYCKHKDGKERWYINTPRANLEPVEPKILKRLDVLFGKQLKKSTSTPTPTKAPIVGGPITPATRKVLEKAKVDTSANADIDAANAELAGNDDIPF